MFKLRKQKAEERREITLSDKIYLPIKFLKVIDHKRLNDYFKKSNPDFYANKAMGFSNYNTPRYIYPHFSNYDGQKHIFTDEDFVAPIGDLDKLRAWLSANKYDIMPVVDKRLEMPLECPLKTDIVLRDYQQVAADSFLNNHTNGMIIARCGAGKTYLALEMIRLIGQNSLIIVHTKALLRQWLTDLKEVFGIEGGQFGDGKKKIKPITVGIINTVVRNIDSLKNEFGVVIIDECHHVSAQSFFDAVNELPAKYKIGLTATPTRKDKKQFLFYSTLGEIRHKIDKQKLVDEGITMKADGIIVKTDYYNNEYLDDPSDYDKKDPRSKNKYFRNMNWLKMQMMGNVERIKLIFKYISESVNEGHKCLVVFDKFNFSIGKDKTTNLIDKWVGWLTQKGIRAQTVAGGSKVDINDIKLQLDKNELDVIIASTTFDEGVDIPCLDRLFLSLPCHKNPSLLEQRIGRIERKHKGKKDAVVYYFLDNKIFGNDITFLKNSVNNIKII